MRRVPSVWVLRTTGFAQGAEVVGPGGGGDGKLDVAAGDALGCVGQSADDL